jgi:DNA sulfur modification protein DndD
MRIEKIALSNYRQFRTAEFVLDRGPSDMHLIIGLNGSGKTNLLNAVNWCLYGDEPHSARDSGRLPVVNLAALQSVPLNGEIVVSVEVKAASPRGHETATFIRNETYRAIGHQVPPIVVQSDLEVRVAGDSGGVSIWNGDEARRLVERFVPKHIREYFFFDGERLDSYFREQSTQNIEAAILELSQVSVLDRIDARLKATHLHLTKESLAQNKLVSELTATHDDLAKKMASVKLQVDQVTEQHRFAKDRLQTLEADLRGVPDVAKVEAERQRLRGSLEDKKKRYAEKENEQAGLLRLAATLIFLRPAMRPVLDAIENRRAHNDLPPPVDRDLLERIVAENSCTICGRGMDAASAQHVRHLLDRFHISTSMSITLLALERSLQAHLRKQQSCFPALDRVAKELIAYEHDMEQLQEGLQSIESQLKAWDVEKTRNLHLERSKYERLCEELMHKLGAANMRHRAYEKELAECRRKLDAALSELQNRGVPVQAVQFALAAHSAIVDAKGKIKEDIRARVENETKFRFLSMVQRLQTFADVRIGPDFVVEVVHQLGYNCIGSLSAAERELLAMAFTLAIHKVSGFDAPLLVDTPVARVADQNRANFAEQLERVSHEKQIILLLTSAEHDGDVSRLLDPTASTRHRLRYAEDELVTEVEVI